MNLHLPGKNGLELMKELYEEGALSVTRVLVISSLGFPGFFVLLSMDTWFHPAFWFAPLFVAGFVAFQRGLIIDIDDGYINDRNDV